MLDMGEPVRIVDVAERFATQHDPPLEIVFTGSAAGREAPRGPLRRGELDVRPVHPLITHVPSSRWRRCTVMMVRPRPDARPSARDRAVRCRRGRSTRDACRRLMRIYLSPPDVGVDERERLPARLRRRLGRSGRPRPRRRSRPTSRRSPGGQGCVALSSGTAALHLALLAVGVQPGDEVLVPTFTFAATANAVTYCGAHPVFIDSDRASWNMYPELLGRGAGRAAAPGPAAGGGGRGRPVRAVRRLRRDRGALRASTACR